MTNRGGRGEGELESNLSAMKINSKEPTISPFENHYCSNEQCRETTRHYLSKDESKYICEVCGHKLYRT